MVDIDNPAPQYRQHGVNDPIPDYDFLVEVKKHIDFNENVRNCPKRNALNAVHCFLKSWLKRIIFVMKTCETRFPEIHKNSASCSRFMSALVSMDVFRPGCKAKQFYERP
jgi:hypothetical protein